MLPSCSPITIGSVPPGNGNVTGPHPIDHADVGGYLLGLWGLPVPVVESIAWHHTPSRAVVKSFGTLSAVHTAEALASPLPAQAFDEAWLAEPGMRERVEGWRKALQNTSNPNKRI